MADQDRARLALWYVTEVAGGNRDPARTLSERFLGTSYQTWANNFARMRPTLLTPAPRRGVAGGELTEYAWGLLAVLKLPDGLEDPYLRSREAYPAPTRRERRTAQPRLSEFASTADFNKAFDTWATSSKRMSGLMWEDSEPGPHWYVETRIGEETYEDRESWFDRMLEEAPTSED